MILEELERIIAQGEDSFHQFTSNVLDMDSLAVRILVLF